MDADEAYRADLQARLLRARADPVTRSVLDWAEERLEQTLPDWWWSPTPSDEQVVYYLVQNQGPYDSVAIMAGWIRKNARSVPDTSHRPPTAQPLPLYEERGVSQLTAVLGHEPKYCALGKKELRRRGCDWAAMGFDESKAPDWVLAMNRHAGRPPQRGEVPPSRRRARAAQGPSGLEPGTYYTTWNPLLKAVEKRAGWTCVSLRSLGRGVKKAFNGQINTDGPNASGLKVPRTDAALDAIISNMRPPGSRGRPPT